MSAYYNSSSEYTSEEEDDESFSEEFPDDCRVMEIHLRHAFTVVSLYYKKQLRIKQDLHVFLIKRDLPVQQLTQELSQLELKVKRYKNLAKSVSVMSVAHVQNMFELQPSSLLMCPSRVPMPTSKEMMEAKKINVWCDAHNQTFCKRCILTHPWL